MDRKTQLRHELLIKSLNHIPEFSRENQQIDIIGQSRILMHLHNISSSEIVRATGIFSDYLNISRPNSQELQLSNLLVRYLRDKDFRESVLQQLNSLKINY